MKIPFFTSKGPKTLHDFSVLLRTSFNPADINQFLSHTFFTAENIFNVQKLGLLPAGESPIDTTGFR